MVWAIASEERTEEDAFYFAEALDLTMPVLYDEDGVVHEDWVTYSEVPAAAYPEEWIVGTVGFIVYQEGIYDYDAVVEVIEAVLGGN